MPFLAYAASDNGLFMNDVHPTEPLTSTDPDDLPNWEELIERKLTELRSLDPAAAPDLAAEVADELAEALDDES